jgi:UDP-N-acetylmuramyl tripeptide synthase
MKRLSWQRFVTVAVVACACFASVAWRYVNLDIENLKTSVIVNDPATSSVTLRSPLALTPTAAAAVLAVTGAEGYSATLRLYADDGDDNADKFSLVSTASNALEFQNNASAVATLSSAGSWNAASYVCQTQVVAMAGCETNTATKQIVMFTGTGVSTNYFTAPSAAGIPLECINMGSGSVLLLDTGTLNLSGTITLGQYDTLTLRSINAATWVQTGTSNN